MALFIVLIVVTVLSVLIAQLAVTTKVEEQIVRSQKGYLEISYSFQSVCRVVMSTLHEDWVADQSEEDDSGGDDPMGALGQGSGPGAPGATGQTAGTTGAATGTQADPDGVTHFDSRHEGWRDDIRENLNGVDVLIRILDGESCFDVNELFWYVVIEDDPDNRGQTSASDALDEATEGAAEGEGEGSEIESDEESQLDDEDDWIAPSEERISRTQDMLAQLIESMIEYNRAAGFDYDQLPDPDQAARLIADWALTRLQDEELRPIRSIDPLRELEEISWELFNGPVDPEDLDEDQYEEESIYEDYSELDDSERPGWSVLEDETGVEEIGRPLGLKHVLTTYSNNGKINMNTVHWVVLSALLIDLPSYDDAVEVAQAVYNNSNDYVEEDPDAPADLSDEEEEETEPEFNQYRVFDDLLIDEEWNNRVEGEDASVWDVFRATLLDTGTAVYHSTTFQARLTGSKEERELEGELILVRSGTTLRVVSWRDLSY